MLWVHQSFLCKQVGESSYTGRFAGTCFPYYQDFLFLLIQEAGNRELLESWGGNVSTVDLLNFYQS